MKKEKHFETEAETLSNVHKIITIFLSIMTFHTVEQNQVIIFTFGQAILRVTILSKGKEAKDDRKGGIYA